ncbi:MAG: UDP-N-acetylmuramate:L-alanyl-gamma-D-glutamyl-meso-diaminopimelate ligase [Planctomycetota bacterium]|jgi:UDP-N-acetylmuramate--alanine ligase
MEFRENQQFEPGAGWLLLGICGSGMRSLCDHLVSSGQRVIGSDGDEEALQLLSRQRLPGVTLVDWGSLQRQVSPPVSTVVHSVAVDSSHPLLVRFRGQGLKVQSLPESLAEQFGGVAQYCVAGTHGKSTTTGMLWWILSRAGRRPARYVGAEFQGPLPFVGSGLSEEFDSAVLEACEYRDSFLTFAPQLCVLTGLEPDHFDWFADLRAMEAGFARFLSRVRSGGRLVYSGDCASSRRLAASHPELRSVSWSAEGNSADWQLDAFPSERRVVFPCRPGGVISSGRLVAANGSVEVPLQLCIPGLHNLRNAAAAILAAMELGVDGLEAARSLVDFCGMRRRFEHRGTWRGVDLIDDYAHHPTAVTCALRTVREVYPGRRVVVLFEPHQMSRTGRLLEDFASALVAADLVFVLPVLPARESAEPGARTTLARRLVEQIRLAGGNAKLVGDLDHSARTLEDAARVGDVIITLGAGRTHLIHDEIHRTIHRDSAA